MKPKPIKERRGIGTHSLNTSQPSQLYFLCLTAIAERFGFYTIRVIIVLYMIDVLSFSNNQSYAIFASFSALFYLAPILGGQAADKFLGNKQATLLGGVLLTIGYLLLALPLENMLYIAL